LKPWKVLIHFESNATIYFQKLEGEEGTEVVGGSDVTSKSSPIMPLFPFRVNADDLVPGG
jgi:hypothetical protein